ncbi:glucose-methanol-choline oxidoreductase [Mycolicibacterium phlei]|uniref:Choline dehydrogenase n=1 Tax=Mycolicibacterium phlei DSM 43239 = CCUG 21000 TaxID=1226750 RepID=A0A5N5UW94_MYCPH|nr:GMC family oxidoreductase N-terminal domain-containing protein [Mycolicibacterium phlei]VEG09471.1 glucose-methanol-choline oxidoreductase [Mycobacteroides chelonae]AMO61357.1 Alcohol dehydrogenase (acceptor) [Mycolicibacterium phlei]EID14070.1 alcohol dehydrogenase [Mycolicibacterium phlei RIVM601174]KAB7752410.1 choline dehydrogenase [Mycolicibacterium phlei DSM 43239 = CCUG 21000]KXW60758.1 choline dehydrogenase [Mycolicibacterium phlei DSM 43239 = CCUG 21000]
MAEFDYIIVGAGSAGCLLANRLSANPEHRVLLIEAGGKDNWFWIKVPVGYLFSIGNPRTDWCYMTEPDPGLAGRSILYARGRVLGGCSSINAMIHMRGQASDYQRWAEATGDERWLWGGDGGPGETLAIYKQLENYFGGADEWHGTDGEIRVERPRVRWKILDAWQAAAAQLGIEPIEEFNRGDNSGSAYFHVNQRRGRRWSMADAFLHPVRHRRNLTVYTDTRALRLLIDDQVREDQRHGAWTTARHRAGGVQLLKDGQIIDVRARREVILSAGAIGSPHLMQVSGLGPADLLARHQVPVVVDLPGVGENLQDHLQIRSVYRVRGARTVNTLYRNWITRAGMGIQYLLMRSGPMTMPPSTLGAFAKSDPSLASPDLEWHVQPLSLPKFGEPLHKFSAITPSVCNLRPTSRGHVRLASADPLTEPKIFCNYLSTDEDREIAVRGLRMTRRIMAAPALARYQPDEMLPGPRLQSDEDLEQAARELGTTIFHPVGTATMGAFDSQGRPRSPNTVLDTDCRVLRVAGLRVVDASAMPTITSGNTNAPVMLIAERAARAILS